ncbi:MAG: hypothetical protein QXM37_04115 [Candidatus Bathyarchaeia archaeon]
MIVTLTKFFGVFLGVFLRTWLPARRKALKMRKLGKEFRWKRVYFKTAAASLVVGFVTSLFVFPSFSYSAVDLFMVFGAAMNYGFGATAVANEVYKLFFESEEEAVGVAE